MLTSRVKDNFAVNASRVYRQINSHRWDVYTGLGLAIVFGIACYMRSLAVDPVLFGDGAWDVWFGSDIPRVFTNMADRKGDASRLSLHLLFSLFTYPPTVLLTAGLHLPPLMAVRMVVAGTASLWIAALFALLRVMGCRLLDATLLSILAGTSAAAMFWFVIPETYPLGSLSLIVALILAALVQHRLVSPLGYTLVSALTLSFTVTNWMVGILVTIVHNRWRQSLQITSNAFSLVVALWCVQKVLFRTAGFFDWGNSDDRKYFLSEKAGGALSILQSCFSHTMVMPAIQTVPKGSQPDYPPMTTQFSALGSSGLWGIVSTGLWFALLALGVWALFTLQKHAKLRLVLGLALLGQIGLHLVYGRETFLYALHFLPFLITLVALSTLSRLRVVVLVLVGALILTSAVNNGNQYGQAIEYFQHHGPKHAVVTPPAGAVSSGEGAVKLSHLS